MKKLAFIAAMAAVGTACAVESDVVGYASQACEAGKWYMVSAQFINVTGEVSAASINLQQFITGLTDKGDTADSKCPILQIWDPAANSGMGDYDTYYFYSRTGGSATGRKYNFWGKDNAKANWETWQKVEIAAGKCGWFKIQNTESGTVTISCAGKVIGADTKEFATKGNKSWNMIANPFPVALNINSNVNWKVAGLIGDTADSKCPIMQSWDPTLNGGQGDYHTYYFYSRTGGSTSGRKYDFWGKDNAKANWETYQKATIPVGCGFWIQYQSTNVDTTICPSGDITFTFTK